MSKRELNEAELLEQEQENVRNLLYFLRIRLDSWGSLAKIVHLADGTVVDIAAGRRNVTASIAFKLARFCKVPIDDLLTGKYPPPGMCPRCGYTDTRGKAKK
jgi:DNA-binding XRE family transcriptional regulator